MLLTKLFTHANPFVIHTPISYMASAIMAVLLIITLVLCYKIIRLHFEK
jgi:hypothetical protein